MVRRNVLIYCLLLRDATRSNPNPRPSLRKFRFWRDSFKLCYVHELLTLSFPSHGTADVLTHNGSGPTVMELRRTMTQTTGLNTDCSRDSYIAMKNLL